MLQLCNGVVRRIIVWPLTLIGIFFTELGGLLLRFSAWALDIPEG